MTGVKAERPAGAGLVKLRPYQRQGVEDIVSVWRSGHRKALYQLPTGGGKTVVGAYIVCALMRGLPGERRVVWLTHRQELREQSMSFLESKGCLAQDLSQVPPKERRLLPGVVSLASPGLKGITFEDVEPADVLVVDEAHHAAASTWSENFIKPWPGMALGLTATPWRMSRKEGLDHIFDKMVCGPTVPELTLEGYLAPVKLLGIPEYAVVQGAGRDQSGDYSPSQTVEANRPILYGDLPVRVWKDRAPPGVRTIWYVPTIDAGHALVSNLHKAGHAAGFVHAGTPAGERKELVSGFRDGSLGSLVNVAVITEGFDCPEADCVVIARPTKSLALYMQMVGRGMRPAPGKHFVYVLDLGQSWREAGVGHPAEARRWSLKPRGKGNGEPGEMVAKECPACALVSPAGLRRCECGHDFGRFCPGCRRFRYAKRWSFACPICDECELTRVGGVVRLRERACDPWRVSAKGNLCLNLGRHKFLVMPSRFGSGWIAGYERKDGKMKWRSGYSSREMAQAYVEVFLESHMGITLADYGYGGPEPAPMLAAA